MAPLGTQIRLARHRRGLTLDALAAASRISKPYLSLIETGRVKYPPSDEKLHRLEQTLGFPPSALVSQAHLIRTPRDIRQMLEMFATQSVVRQQTTVGIEESAEFDATVNGSNELMRSDAIEWISRIEHRSGDKCIARRNRQRPSPRV